MINAFVDIAKDPYIVKLNVNAWTYNMVSFLLRTGKGAQTFYFVRQPILVEMANEVLKTKGKYGIDRTKTPSQLEKEAIEKVLDKYDPTKKLRRKYEYINRKNETKASEYQDLFRTYIDDKGEITSRTRQLLKINPEDSKDFNEEQVRIYYAWLALKPYADDLANLVKFSKIDTKKTGKTFAEQDIYYKGMKDMEENSKFAKGEVTRFFNETFIRTKTENSIPLGSSIFRNLLLRNTDQFANQKHIALSLVGRAANADSKLLSAVINGMEAQIKSQFFNQYVKDNNIDLNTMFQGRNSIPNRLYRFKQEVLKGNPRLSHLLNNDGTIANDFVNYLIPNINKEGLDFIDRSEQLNADQAQANNLINYWRQLLDDPEPSVKRLFRDLAVYSFYTSGDNTVMNAFFQYLPNSERVSMGYTQFIQGKLDQMVNNADKSYNDIEDLFLNNWQNDKLVRPVDMYGGKYQAPLRSVSLNKDAAMPNIILGQRTDMQAAVVKPLNWVTIDDVKYPIFPPYVKIKDNLGFEPANWHVYRLIGYIDKPERTWQGKLTGRTLYTPIYGLVSKKGYSYKGHTIIEYGLSTQFEFNKENEWDYFEALNNLDALSDMTDEVERTYFEQDKVYMHHIGELPSYSGMNYAISEQDRAYMDDSSTLEEDEVTGEVLEEEEEPTIDYINKTSYQNVNENKTLFQNKSSKKLNFDEVASKVFDLVNKLGIQTVLVDPSQLVQGTTAAQYDSDNNRILLRNDYESYLYGTGTTLNYLLLHEYIHVITSYAIDNADEMPADVQAAVKTIEAAYKTLLEKEKGNYTEFMGRIILDNNDYYGLTSKYEMIAELANPNFRKILSKHNLLDELISNIKDLIFKLFDKFGISHNSTLEDSLIASLNTLVDNFNSMVYNNWNKTRTAQRWFRDNIQRVSLNKFIGNKVMNQVNEQLENKPYEEVAEITINIPISIAENIYNQLGGQNAKNKPFVLSFDDGPIVFARLTGLKPSDKKMQGKYGELDTYNMTVETHPEIIPIEEYEKAGNQYRPLADINKEIENYISMENRLDLFPSSLPLTGIELMALYEQGNSRISEVLDQMEDLTPEERQTYLNEFAQFMTDNKVDTQDKLEEALRKFICNL